MTTAAKSTGTLAQALLAFQAEAPALQKNKINPAFRAKYLTLDAMLEQVLPVLNKHGLVVVQRPTILAEGTPGLRTRIIHAPSGECEEDVMPLLLAKQDPQGLGSAITYARRYSLMAMLGLAADEDDDGNKASGGQGPRFAPAMQPAAKQEPKPNAAAKPSKLERDMLTEVVDRLIKGGQITPEQVASAAGGPWPGVVESMTAAQVKSLTERLERYANNVKGAA